MASATPMRRRVIASQPAIACSTSAANARPKPCCCHDSASSSKPMTACVGSRIATDDVGAADHCRARIEAPDEFVVVALAGRQGGEKALRFGRTGRRSADDTKIGRGRFQYALQRRHFRRAAGERPQRECVTAGTAQRPALISVHSWLRSRRCADGEVLQLLELRRDRLVREDRRILEDLGLDVLDRIQCSDCRSRSGW